MNKQQYKKYLCSKYWKALRAKRVRMDGGVCTMCGSKFELQVHHKSYKNIGVEEKEILDIVTLCSICHKKEHLFDKKNELQTAKGKFSSYIKLISDNEHAELKYIVETTMKYNNIVQPFILTTGQGRSEEYVIDRIDKMKKSYVLMKSIAGYVINPYIFNNKNCDKDYIKHIKKYFKSIYNDFQKQLLEKQIKKEK